MKFGVVLFPSKNIQDFANSYRKRYDANYALIPPHLTLRSSFEANENEIQVITEKIAGIAKKLEPITIEVKKFSSFAPVNNVIYLKVKPTTELANLHEELRSSFEGEQEYSFVPHITIGQKLSDAEHSDIYGTLKMEKVDFKETIDRIHLLYQLENGSWTVFETFRLGKE